MDFIAPHFVGLRVGEILEDQAGDEWTVIAIELAWDAILMVSADGQTVDGDTSVEFAKEGYTRKFITSAINQLAQNVATNWGSPSPIQPAPATPPVPAAPFPGIMSYLPGSAPIFSFSRVLTSGPAKPGKRQVSHNGKDWVDYAKLYDPDDYESYEHRREI